MKAGSIFGAYDPERLALVNDVAYNYLSKLMNRKLPGHNLIRNAQVRTLRRSHPEFTFLQAFPTAQAGARTIVLGPYYIPDENP